MFVVTYCDYFLAFLGVFLSLILIRLAPDPKFPLDNSTEGLGLIEDFYNNKTYYYYCYLLVIWY